MIRYIALLRGINVGGHRKIKMADLREIFISAGFTNVTTYIQSGNIIFDSSETNTELLAQTIEQAVENNAGFHSSVLLRTISDLEKLVLENPFEGRQTEGHKLYITFFEAEPPPGKQQELLSYGSEREEFTVRKRELYSLINKGIPGKPIFSNSFIEKHFEMPATTRNWRSVNKILGIARS